MEMTSQLLAITIERLDKISLMIARKRFNKCHKAELSFRVWAG
jgi:hypothetical protein